jgi:hypothetical protein
MSDLHKQLARMAELYALKSEHDNWLYINKGNMEDCPEKTAYLTAFSAWQQNIKDYMETSCYRSGYDTLEVQKWRASFRDAVKATTDEWTIVRLGVERGKAYRAILDELKGYPG